MTSPCWPGPDGTAAPANAIPEVLAAVQQVLPSNSEDGVAQLLESLVETRNRFGARPDPVT